ncbi:MAG: hypothetical protein INR71_10835 [Terriglobus roseus]|nr:hypothetical protein [Terriglobus roseus]
MTTTGTEADWLLTRVTTTVWLVSGAPEEADWVTTEVIRTVDGGALEAVAVDKTSLVLVVDAATDATDEIDEDIDDEMDERTALVTCDAMELETDSRDDEDEAAANDELDAAGSTAEADTGRSVTLIDTRKGDISSQGTYSSCWPASSPAGSAS